MGWGYPYLGGDLVDDAVRLVAWINHLAVDKGHPASTVDSYVTGAKQILGQHLVFSDALGRAGEPRHVWVQSAVRSVAETVRGRVPYTAEWILEGRSSWPVPVYVAVVSIFMATLRSGELISDYSGQIGPHLLWWENLEFVVRDARHGRRVMGPEEIRLVCADSVQFKPVTRKHQARGKVRAIPPVTRLFYPADGHPDVNLFDLSLKVDMCAVTLLQSWFIALVSVGEFANSLPTSHAGRGRSLGRQL